MLLYTKLPGKTSTPLLDVQLYAGEVHDIVKSVCKISRKNLASGQTQQNFSFIQAAKGRRSGEVRRRRTTERDAAIVRAVQAGVSIHRAAYDFALDRSTIRHILRRATIA